MRRILLLPIVMTLSFFTSAQFTPGRLVVVRMGVTGAGSAPGSAATPIFLDEYTTAGTAGITVALPTTTSGNINRITGSGSASSENMLNLSVDGRYLTIGGYDANVGLASVNSTAGVNRVIARIANDATVATTVVTTLDGTATNNSYTTNNFRSVVTNDGTRFWLGGNGSASTGGVRTVAFSGSSTTPVIASQVSNAVNNVRVVSIFNGQLYFSTNAGTAGIYTVGTGLPTNSGTAALNVMTNADAYSYVLIDRGGGNWNCYLSNATTPGVFKYSSIDNGVSWTARGSVTSAAPIFGLAGKLEGGTPAMYVTTQSSVLKITDAAVFNANITGAFATIATAPANTFFRGIAFAPENASAISVVPSPSSVDFGNIAVGSSSSNQAISLTAANLTPSAGSLSINSSNNTFEVSTDGSTWGSSASVNYSANGTTIGSFLVRFSPASNGAQSGTVSITGGGLAIASTVAVNGFGGLNNLALSFTAVALSSSMQPPVVSGVINDPTDPAATTGISVDVKENGAAITAAGYSLTAASSNTTVVPNANIIITKNDGQAFIKINPAAAGYSNITLTLSKDVFTKTLVINYAASVASSTPTFTHFHSGSSDASAAIAIDDNYMIVADDEMNKLLVYDRNHSGLPITSFDYSNLLSLTETSGGIPREVDVEGSVRSINFPNRIYWFGSMSNSATNFVPRPNRDRVFAMTTAGTGAATSFSFVGMYISLRQQLINWGDANGYNLTASAAPGADPKLIDGFNIEGICFAPGNTSLYVAFRAPLIPVTARTKALIAPILNFENWFNNGSPSGPASIGAPIELDLGGRGFRDLVRLSNGKYVILAGNYDDLPLNGAVFTWDGNAAHQPIKVNAFDVTGLNPEAVIELQTSGLLALDRLQILSDNGSVVYYGDGTESKDLLLNNFKKFRSDIVVSSQGNVLPVIYHYVLAEKINNNVRLSWKAEVPDVGVYFEVQRSLNGRDFSTIGIVNSIINQSSYQYFDPVTTQSKIYYRIRAVELTGKAYYSVVRIVNSVNNTGSLSIYPNPVSTPMVSVSVNLAGEKRMNVFDMNGKLYRQYNFSASSFDINTSAWLKGIYLFVMINGEKTLSEFVIVRW